MVLALDGSLEHCAHGFLLSNFTRAVVIVHRSDYFFHSIHLYSELLFNLSTSGVYCIL